MNTEIYNQAVASLEEKGFEVIRQDLNRPWGGFLCIGENQAPEFITHFFGESLALKAETNHVLSPKILLVKPNSRLSWQYHHRRSEFWKVIRGKAGVVRSKTDEQGPVEFYMPGELISLSKGERHRLIAADSWVVIAEIWQHTDSNHLSDEEDIVRLQDDFGR